MTSAAPQPQMRFDFRSTSDRPLWPMKAAMVFLRRNEDDILALIESRRISFAFDLRTPRSRRAFPLLWAGSCVSYKNSLPETTHELIEVINSILPWRDLRATEAKDLFSVNQGHVANLIKAGKLTVSRPGASKTASPWITRASLAALLEERWM